VSTPKRYHPRPVDISAARAAEARMLPAIRRLHEGASTKTVAAECGIKECTLRRFLEKRALFITELRKARAADLPRLIKLHGDGKAVKNAPPEPELPLGRPPTPKEIAALSNVSRGGRVVNISRITGLTAAQIHRMVDALGGLDHVQARKWGTLEAKAALMGQVG
jgi:hypothetical protein